MNLLLLDREELVDGVAWIQGRRARHIVEVLGAEVGSRLKVGVVGENRYVGKVVAIQPEQVGVKVDLEDPSRTPAGARPPVDLVLALPRPQAVKRILEHVSTLGVGSIDLINSWRVEKSYFSSPQLEPQTIRQRLIKGAEQGMSTWIPKVAVHRLLVPFVEGLSTTAGEQRLIAHPEAPDDIDEVVGAETASVRIAIGPEGGWIDREVDTFTKAGFSPVRLGSRVLRVETAVVVALAQLSLLARQHGRGSW